MTLALPQVIGNRLASGIPSSPVLGVEERRMSAMSSGKSPQWSRGRWRGRSVEECGGASSRGAANRPHDDRDRRVATVTDLPPGAAGLLSAELPIIHGGSWSSTGGHSAPGGSVSGWHARGQGFKSPQLHQALRLLHTSARRLVPVFCQRVTRRTQSSTLSVVGFGDCLRVLGPLVVGR